MFQELCGETDLGKLPERLQQLTQVLLGDGEGQIPQEETRRLEDERAVTIWLLLLSILLRRLQMTCELWLKQRGSSWD